MRKTRIVTLAVALLIGTEARAQAVTPSQQNRPLLEQQLRERMAQVTRNRLGLDDAQMTKLQEVNSRHAPQMSALATRERETRQQLRQQMVAATPDQATVGRLLDTLLGLQRQRISLLESEQKDLSAFLTPVQRAKYMGLQQQIKRRADQLRLQSNGRRGGRAGNPPLR